jgi:Sugar kinases, ribokinase family
MSLEILGVGCVALDESLLVDDYPAEDAKIAIRERSRRLGGITANALAAAARLGARSGFAGTLGDDHASRRVLGELNRAGVDISLVRRQADARPIRSTIISSGKTRSRTILYDLACAVGATPDWPPEDAIRGATVLLIDHFGMEGMLRAAKIAAAAGIPIVADFESNERPDFGELLALVDHLILSCNFAQRIAGADNPARAADLLWTNRRQAVVVTCGREGCWFRAADSGPLPQHVPAIAVAVHDTTGCGDVFRGAYAAALVQSSASSSLARVRFATAAAALRAAATTPADRFPDRPAVDRLFAQTWPMP